MPRHLYDIASLAPLIEAGYTLLTPNFRLARRIGAEWSAREVAAGRQVFEPLVVLPLERWLEQRWQQALATGLVPARLPLQAAQLAQLWQQVIAEEELASDSYHLLRPTAAAELAARARDDLLRWQVDLDDESLRQVFNLDTDCGTFLRWRDLFEQRLEALACCSFTDCVSELAGLAGKLQAPPVALLEFDDVPPLYMSAARALCPEVHEVTPAANPADASRCLGHSFDDHRQELAAVARWAADLQRREPEATVGVIVSDMSADRGPLEYLMRREFDCLGANYTALPVNFSTGISLDQAPVVRDALALLALGRQQVAVPAVVRLMQSRFVDLPDADASETTRFVTRLYEQGRAEIPVADLRYAARGLSLGSHLLAVSNRRELRGKTSPSGWCERFCELLDIWGWPRGPLDSLEYQQVELWYRSLDSFKAFDAVCPPLGYEAALELLSGHCATQVSQPQTPDTAVQVLGPLEAAGLHFDHLWLVGMQAAKWPAAARPNPFIPQVLQRDLDMPHATAAREWRFAESLIEQYRRGAGEFNGSFTRQVDGVPELPSAFMATFTPVDHEELPAVDASWLARSGQAMELLQDDRAPVLAGPELQEISGGSGLLEDQSQCPFRAFTRRRLAVQPLGEFSVALSAADRGSLLHDALFALWGSIVDRDTLAAMDAQSERQVVLAAVDSALEALAPGLRRQMGTAYWQLEAQRLAALLGEWLAVERQREQFVVALREESVVVPLEQLKISLRVDRIDELADGSRVIIDYKSGRSKTGDWLGDRPARPQLLLYGLAEEEPPSAISFAQLRSRDCRFVGLGKQSVAPGIATDIGKVTGERMAAEDWPALNREWAENLRRLAQEFVAGAAAVDPLAPDSCTWCGLQPLCRVNDQGGTR